MKIKSALYLGVATLAVAVLLVGVPARLDAQQNVTVNIGATDLGGVVNGPKGRKPAFGSSPKPPTCRPRWPRSW